ncbi:MAG: carbohydrate-binding family 9-like protein [Verrucomicrobia bacterium]|nr:carbohydrate-binding family 9-like protein [Verrucomicrobiota bacterium]
MRIVSSLFDSPTKRFRRWRVDAAFARVTLCVTIGFCLTADLHASSAEDWSKMKHFRPKDYVCYRASSPVQIDGKLDEAAWAVAPWTKFFQDIEGDRKPHPRLHTRAKMLWDDDYFYVAAELEEPHVWGTITNRDAVIFQDNDFEVFIDPNGDNHEYYEFEMNALNTGWDLFLNLPYKDGGKARDEWNIAGLKTAVQVRGTLNDPTDRDAGWSVEIAFPWKALAEYAHRAAPPKNGDQWRVDFSRVEWRHEIVDGKYRKLPGLKEDNWVWSPTGIVDMHRPERWGFVQFATGSPGKAKFAPDPAMPVRDLLHEIYYVERSFHEKHARYSVSLKELGLNDLHCRRLIARPRIQLTPEGFWATAEIKLPGGNYQRWHIRQDSKIWPE